MDYPSGGGGSLAAIAAYSVLGNTTNASAVPTAVTAPIIGTPGFTATAGTVATQVTGAPAGNYFQHCIQNTSAANGASSDFVVTCDTGNDSVDYADFGINNSGGGSTPFTAAKAAYLYTTTNELDIGALGAGGTINFYTTGGTSSPVKAVVINSGGSTQILGALSCAGNATVTGSVTIGAGSGYYWSGRSALLCTADGTVTMSNNAGTGFTALQLGPTTATPSATVIRPGSVVAGTTNAAGANFTIQCSQGTGTGVGGSFIVQVAPAGTTGSSQNALVTVLTIDASQNATFTGQVSATSFYTANTVSCFATSFGNSTNTQVSSDGSTLYLKAYQTFQFTTSLYSSTVIMMGEANNTWAMRNSTNAQEFRTYGTYTDSTHYSRLYSGRYSAGYHQIGVEGGNASSFAGGLQFYTSNASGVATLAMQIDTSQNVTFAGMVKSANAGGSLFYSPAVSTIGGGFWLNGTTHYGQIACISGSSDGWALGYNGGVIGSSSFTSVLKWNSDNSVTMAGTLSTADSTSGAGPAWNLGSKKTGTVALDTSKFVEIAISGTIIKILTAV